MTPERTVRLLNALASDLEQTIHVGANPDPVILAGHLAMVARLLAIHLDPNVRSRGSEP